MVYKNPLETSYFPIMHEIMYIEIYPRVKISKQFSANYLYFPRLQQNYVVVRRVQEFKLTKCVPPPPPSPSPPPSFFI